jgi:hypothetical protein
MRIVRRRDVRRPAAGRGPEAHAELVRDVLERVIFF